MSSDDCELVTAPDGKYPHLVTGWCAGCRWTWTGAAKPFVVEASYDRDHERAGRVTR